MQPGDVVQLKSGGPMMTIEKQADRGEWLCVWWAGDEIKSRSFVEIALKVHGTAGDGR